MLTPSRAVEIFEALAEKAGVASEDVEAAKEASRPSDRLGGLAYLTELFKELIERDDAFEDFLLGAEGRLAQLTLHTDEDCGYDISRDLEGEALDIFKRGQPVAYHDADRWLVLDGLLYRVHPEGRTKLGPFLDYVEAQVTAALDD